MARNWLRGNAAWHQKRTTQPKWSKKERKRVREKKANCKISRCIRETGQSETERERERWREFCNLWWLTKWFISVVYWPFNWIFHLILFGRCSFFLSGSLIHLSICLFLLTLCYFLWPDSFSALPLIFFSRFYFQYDFVFYVWFVLFLGLKGGSFAVSMILILFIGKKSTVMNVINWEKHV